MAFEKDYFMDKNIKTVLHIGADRGGELPYYKDMGVKKVVWVEANPEVYRELLDMLTIMEVHQYYPDGSGVESLPFNCLISDIDDESTEFYLYYGPDAQYLQGNKGCSSLFKASPHHYMVTWYRGTIVMPSNTIDTFLERNNLGYNFDLLTMDVQGAELKVLKGAKKLLDNVRYINTEIAIEAPQYQGNVLFDELERYCNLFCFKHSVD